jgi:hypothetical protein
LVTISKLQVALLADAKQVQIELSELSLDTDTNSHEEIMNLLQESCLVLLRNADNPIMLGEPLLRDRLLMLQKNPELGEAMRQLIMADNATKLDSLAAYKLESTGLVNLTGDNAAISCDLYRLYFRERLQQF